MENIWGSKRKLICQSRIGKIWPEEMGEDGVKTGRESALETQGRGGEFSLPDFPGEEPRACDGGPRPRENPFPWGPSHCEEKLPTIPRDSCCSEWSCPTEDMPKTAGPEKVVLTGRARDKGMQASTVLQSKKGARKEETVGMSIQCSPIVRKFYS